MRIAGIGLNSQARKADITQALTASGAGDCDGFAAAAAKIDSRLMDVALALGKRLFPVSEDALKAAANRARTSSPRLAKLTGGASLAECAALAAAGPGARLVMARQVHGNVTIAVAEAGVIAGEAT